MHKVWLRVLVISSLLTTGFLWHAPACRLVNEEKLLVCESCGNQLCSRQNGCREARKTISVMFSFKFAAYPSPLRV